MPAPGAPAVRRAAEPRAQAPTCRGCKRGPKRDRRDQPPEWPGIHHPGVARPGRAASMQPQPPQIRQVRAGVDLRRFQAPVPLVYLSVSLTGPAPSGGTDTSRLCGGRLPPFPAPPGSGCPPASPLCCDRTAAEASHLHSINQRLTAYVPEVPPIRDLYRVRQCATDGFGVGDGAISADHPDTGMLA